MQAAHRTLPLARTGFHSIGGPVAAAAIVLVGMALALSPGLVAMAVAVAVAVGLLALVRPELGLFLLVLSVPVQDLVRVGSDTADLTLTKTLAVLVIGAWLAAGLGLRRPLVRDSSVALAFSLFVLALVVSLVAATSLVDGLIELGRWILEALLVYLAATVLLQTRRHLTVLVVCFIVAGSVEAALGLVQFMAGAGPKSFMIADQFSRAYGTFGMPNSYAGYLGMVFPLSLALLRWSLGDLRNGRHQSPAGTTDAARPRDASWWVVPTVRTLVLTFTSLLLFAALVASYSRGAWVGVIVALIVMAVVSGRVFPLVAALVLAWSTVSLLGAFELLPPDLEARVGSIVSDLGFFDVRKVMTTPENFAIVERMAMWQTGLAMFTANPILGVGIGNFNTVFSQYAMPLWPDTRGHAHNYYIQVMAEAGTVGLLAYLGLIGSVLWRGFKTARRATDPYLRSITVGLVGIIGAMAGHNFFENLHVLGMGVHFAAVLAALTLVGRLNRGSGADGDASTAVSRVAEDTGR